MYEINFVRKRLIRKWVAIGAGISSIVVATLSIVSFLGRFVGTFTVRLETGDVKLALSESHEFSNPSTYLHVGEIPTLQEYTYSGFENIGDNNIDTDETTYLTEPAANFYRDGVTIRSINYFKYTFYIRNIGDIDASYDMKVKILDSKDDNGREVQDTLRVMIYGTEDDGTQSKSVYAKRSASKHTVDGVDSFDELISTPEYGYAKQFESTDVIKTIPVNNFKVGDERRYTIVFWLEGNDPQSTRDVDVPVNAKIKIGVEINAYEN